MNGLLPHGFALGLGALVLCGSPAAAQNPVLNPANGHYYEAVSTPIGTVPWDVAKTQAEGMSYLGVQGHLVTIADDAENTFVWTQLVSPNANQHWIGAYQDRNAPDYSEPAGGWRWVTGEPWNYLGWFAPGEPNNYGGNEDWACFDHQAPAWNDVVLDYYWNVGFLVEYDVSPGVAYCFGNTASGNPCPCGNDNDGSLPEGGCQHDDSDAGARLDASGNASVTGDSLLLLGTRGPVSNSTLFFQANNDLNATGNYLGDGIRCAGGGLIRLKVKTTDASGSADSSPTVISTRSASFGHTITPGETLYYQWWIRDPGGSPCGDENNTSNGFEITWTP